MASTEGSVCGRPVLNSDRPIFSSIYRSIYGSIIRHWPLLQRARCLRERDSSRRFPAAMLFLVFLYSHRFVRVLFAFTLSLIEEVDKLSLTRCFWAGLNVIKGIPNATIQFIAYDTIKSIVMPDH